MAKRKRPKRRKKSKYSIFWKIALSVFAVSFIALFFYYLFHQTKKSYSVEQILNTSYQKVFNKKANIEKSFDEKGNIVFTLKISSKKLNVFRNELQKELPSDYKVNIFKAKNRQLLKIDTKKEICKVILIASNRKLKKRKKKNYQELYEEKIVEKKKPKYKERKKKKKIKKIKGQPLVAIIIDDCGIGHMKAFKKGITIPYPITFAILPFRTHSRECAYLAHGKGYDVILHMPMEPISYPKADPGPGAIMHTDTESVIVKKLDNAFKNIVFAKGFNNHMGSLITQSRFAVRVILSYAKKHHKFFIDSRTIANSVVEEEAAKINFKVLSRDVFLDNVIDEAHIKKQLNLLVKKAYENGYAIAIGHNYPTTINTLFKEMPKLDRKVNFVFVRKLVYGNY